MEQILGFTKGMYRDVHPRNQIESTYTDALNSVLYTDKGQMTTISTEKGNEICVSLPDGYTDIGSINTDSDEIIIFLTNNAISKISIYNPEFCTYKEIISSSCLNFSKEHPIHGVFKVRKGCERFIYFTDGENPVRAINIDSINDYLNNNGEFDCALATLDLPFQLPEVTTEISNSGGSLEVGSYQFAFRYLDEDGNYTD